MPTYEYRCKSCQHQFDAVQAFTDDSLTECPECGGVLKKVFGNVGITFKGSGFYKTDSRSAGSFGSTKDADRTDAKKGADAESSSKTDSKKADSSSNGSSGSTATSSSSSGSDKASSTSSTSSSSGSSTPASSKPA